MNDNKVINILGIDVEYDNVFSMYNKKVLTDLGYTVNIIGVDDVPLGELIISPYLIMRNKDFIDNLDTKKCDLLALCEDPIFDITQPYKTKTKPKYNLFLCCFNNDTLKNVWFSGNHDDFYDYCKNNNFVVKTALTNVLVKEKMIIYDICFISLRDRLKYKNKFKSML